VAIPDDRSAGDGIHTETRAALRVSAYDQVASLLIALLIVIGFFVALLFIIWLTSRLLFTQRTIPVELVEYSGRGDHAAGFRTRLGRAGMEEVEELMEPSLEATLEAVTDLVSSQAAAFDMIETAAEATGRGTGMGDSRGPGPLGDGSDDVIPPWERWEIRFSTSGVDAYARQLDFFKIELGAAGGGSPVWSMLRISRLPSPRGVLANRRKKIGCTCRTATRTAAGRVRQTVAEQGRDQGRSAAGAAVLLERSRTPVDDHRGLDARGPRTQAARVSEDHFRHPETRTGFEFHVVDQFFRSGSQVCDGRQFAGELYDDGTSNGLLGSVPLQ
jgi:hypothetical protein